MDEPIKVLIVEDEPIILRYVMQKICELEGGYEVAAGVDNALEALKLIGEKPPDILLTDIEMEGMNGLELIREAKERHPQLRTVVLSGYNSFDYAQTALRYSTDDYLLKPVESGDLQKVFTRLREKIEAQRNQTGFTPMVTIGEAATLPQQIERYLTEKYSNNVTMSDLAVYFNYAPSYISRIFKKEYGCSPIHYQIKQRMKYAKQQLIQASPQDIKQIALSVGYEDARYFSRVFRQMEGMTPSDWSALAYDKAAAKKQKHGG